MHAGTVVKMNAINHPDKLGWQDKNNECTFKEWNERACRVAHGLSDLGVGYKDRFAVLAFNRGEWLDIYAVSSIMQNVRPLSLSSPLWK
jgi:long-subunit acyl-CoA synthetase (AMP-forming)